MKNPIAICERPALWVHRNNTVGLPSWCLPSTLARARSRWRAKRSASSGRKFGHRARGGRTGRSEECRNRSMVSHSEHVGELRSAIGSAAVLQGQPLVDAHKVVAKMCRGGRRCQSLVCSVTRVGCRMGARRSIRVVRAFDGEVERGYGGGARPGIRNRPVDAAQLAGHSSWALSHTATTRSPGDKNVVRGAAGVLRLHRQIVSPRGGRRHRDGLRQTGCVPAEVAGNLAVAVPDCDGQLAPGAVLRADEEDHASRADASAAPSLPALRC